MNGDIVEFILVYLWLISRSVFVLFPRRAENINDFDRFIKGIGFVFHAARDNIYISGLEYSFFITNDQLHLTLDEGAHLLVRVAVTGHMRIWVEINNCQEHLFAPKCSGVDARDELFGITVCGIVEVHYLLLYRQDAKNAKKLCAFAVKLFRMCFGKYALEFFEILCSDFSVVDHQGILIVAFFGAAAEVV